MKDLKYHPDSFAGKFDEEQFQDFLRALKEGEFEEIEFEPEFVEHLRQYNGGEPGLSYFTTPSGAIFSVERFLHFAEPEGDLEYAFLPHTWATLAYRLGPFRMPFAELTGGDQACFDYSHKDEHGRPAVVVWRVHDHPDNDLEVVTHGFVNFLECLREREKPRTEASLPDDTLLQMMRHVHDADLLFDQYRKGLYCDDEEAWLRGDRDYEEFIRPIPQEVFEQALEELRSAEELLPAPKYSWEESEQVFGGYGRVYSVMGDYQKALDSYQLAAKSPSANGDLALFYALRIGICHYELGDMHTAKDVFLDIYRRSGGGAWHFEDSDPKYFRLIENDIE